MQQIVRYSAVLYLCASNRDDIGLFRSAVLNPGAFTYFTIIVTLTAGTAF